MKFKTKYSLYVPDLVGLLVALTLIVWCSRGQKHDKAFVYSLWLSCIALFEFMVRIIFESFFSFDLTQGRNNQNKIQIPQFDNKSSYDKTLDPFKANIFGKWFHGGLFVYNLSILRTLLVLLKGFLFLQITLSSLQRIVYILKMDKRSKFLAIIQKYFTALFIISLGIIFGYSEFNLFQQEKAFLVMKPNTYQYINPQVERIVNLINQALYAVAFVISMELFARLRKQNFLYLGSSAIFFLLTFITSNYEAYLYIWGSLFEMFGLYLIIWAQSSLTKREELIMMIYD